jgi:YfiH family protein
MMEILRPNWPAPSNISAFFTTRVGGISSHPWNTNNLSYDVGDKFEFVLENWRLLTRKIDLPPNPQLLNQVHGTNIVIAECSGTIKIGDGSYSKKAGIVCSVTTADCIPALICNTQGSLVAAVHLGWRGLSAGIINSLVDILQVPAADLIVYLGPAISQENFEVGSEVREKFLLGSNETDTIEKINSCFIKKNKNGPDKNDKWKANLYELAKVYLNQNGIFDIYGGDFCTYNDSKRFYSYRRDGVTGRMASLIWFS